MVQRHTINGYNDLKNFLKTRENGPLVLLFSGTTAEGVCWCPDCEAADPIIEEVLKEVESKSFDFVEVNVGSREEWKNTSCPFRTDSALKLTSVPTLLVWGTEKKLNDNECQDKDLVSLLFEEL